ncbi:MAG: hypothetical protein GY803_21735 [Chloroflexi bacterium]|nr:hypothetical protein [Chloroflexota bacterium]
MESLQPILIGFGAIIAFVTFWAFVVLLTSWIGGWSKLADVYPARIPFNETCWSWQNGRFRWGMGYNGVLKVCADTQALHLSVFVLFRPGHPPLSIPWEDITGRKRTFWVELRFRRAENLPVRISSKLAGQLEQAVAGQWRWARETP